MTADCVQYEVKVTKVLVEFVSQHARKYCKCRMYLCGLRSYKIKWETYAVEDTDTGTVFLGGESENIPHHTIIHTGGHVKGW